jgi:UDP-N-acetylmuramyl tripeptide synthase
MRKNRPSQPTSPQENSTDRASQMDHPLTVNEAEDAKHKKRRLSRERSSLRAGLAVVAGRTAGALSRRLHVGGGTSIIGVVAQRIDPHIVEHLAIQLEYGSVLITGTNGKTTTSSFIAAIVRDSGLRVWHNREGSNLVRGIASSLIIRALPSGQLRRSGQAISIFEVDEAALPQIVQSISPRVTVFTNLFRDQLDRYGEVNNVIAHWQQAIQHLPETSILVLNADDPAIASLGESFAGKTLYYGIDDPALNLGAEHTNTERPQVIDTRTCPRCGNTYEYSVHFYSHMGHYSCSYCETQRPQPDVRATSVHVDSLDRIRMRVTAGVQQRDIVIPLPGLYNVYNALASITATLALGLEWEPITSGIEQSKPAFGRGERIQAEGRTLRLLLAKNPVGFNEVLRTLLVDSVPRHILFVLNDNIADGRDISWIWDVDFEQIVGHIKTVTVAGTRALDLALRLKYAGTKEEDLTIIPPGPSRALRNEATRRQRIYSKQARKLKQDTNKYNTSRTKPIYGLKNALNTALEQTPVGETLFVIPTYTGLLEVHRELESRGLTPHYWEGKDA